MNEPWPALLTELTDTPPVGDAIAEHLVQGAWIALTDQRFDQFSGTDAERFLQGQSTCDVRQRQAKQMLPGAFCNAKGRVYADFLLGPQLDEEDGESILLRWPTTLAEPALEQLTRYLQLFRKASLTAHAPLIAVGVVGAHTAKALQGLWPTLPSQRWQAVNNDVGRCIGIDPAQGAYELWLKPAQWPILREALQTLSPSSLATWRAAMIRAGIAQLSSVTREAYVPQMLNLDQLGAISFQKGCYTGQEVVARSHYLGKQKRRLFQLQGAATPQLLDAIVNSENQKVGEIITIAQLGPQCEILAVLHTEAVQAASLHWKDSDTPPLHLKQPSGEEARS